MLSMRGIPEQDAAQTSVAKNYAGGNAGDDSLLCIEDPDQIVRAVNRHDSGPPSFRQPRRGRTPDLAGARPLYSTFARLHLIGEFPRPMITRPPSNRARRRW